MIGGESGRAVARALGCDHRNLARAIAKQEKAEREATAASQDRARQRFRDHALATKQGQPWNPDALSHEDVAEAGAALGVDPVPDPAYVPREFPLVARKPEPPKTTRRRKAQPVEDSRDLRRLPDGTSTGRYELPEGVSHGYVISGPSDFGLKYDSDLIQVLAAAGQEGRLLEDPRYPGQNRFSQPGTRDRVWLGRRRDMIPFASYVRANYEPLPARGPQPGRVLGVFTLDPINGVQSVSRDGSSERDHREWLQRNRDNAEDLAEEDKRRFEIRRLDTNERIATYTGIEHATARAESHARTLGVDVQPVEVPRDR
jgi:hypothetical protein